MNVPAAAGVCLLAVWTSAAAQPDCRVLDVEIAHSYQGGCRNGLAHGKGVASGLARYEGEFRSGRKHGNGVKTWPWGDRYEGAFVDDRKQGRGVYTWGEGSRWAGERYEGDFLADQRHGWGLYTWPSGDRFDGRWDKDQQLGESAMEIRRRRAQQAQQMAFLRGVVVCRVAPGGDAGIVRAMVESLDAGTLTVRLTEVPEGSPPAFSVGHLVAEEAVSWAPCL